MSIPPQFFCTHCGIGPRFDAGACAACGKIGRTAKLEFDVEVRQRSSLDYEARPAGKRKFSVKGRLGASFHRLTQRWHVLRRVIDRTNNQYSEHITDAETGKVIRTCEEPLSEHQGRGSAKFKRK